MAGVYIPGMELPLAGMCKTITIFDNGTVVRANGSETLGKAIPVPDHGRLIDADALGNKCIPEPSFVAEMLFRKIQNAPTIIPADKEETE